MLRYTVIDKRTNKEVNALDVLLNDRVITESYYKFQSGDSDDEPDSFEDCNDWDRVFSLSPNGILYIEGVDTSGGDYARITHYVDIDRYEAVLVSNN